MHDCGHSEKLRATVLSGAIGKYKDELKNHTEVVKPIQNEGGERAPKKGCWGKEDKR